MDLNKKIIFITGATSGFGEATARLARKTWPQASLWITGRRADRLQKLATELQGDVKTFAFDVREREGILKITRENVDELDRLAVIVNNAGLAAGFDFFQDAQMSDLDAMIDTNVKGLVYVTQALLPFLLKNKSGHIINLGSIAGKITYPRGHVYNATKFAVRALSDALRLDILGSGVRVTNIEPGMAETEFSKVRFHGDETKAKAVYQGLKPLQAEDIAETIVWCLQRPQHVDVQELVIMPTDQASPRDVFRNQHA